MTFPTFQSGGRRPSANDWVYKSVRYSLDMSFVFMRIFEEMLSGPGDDETLRRSISPATPSGEMIIGAMVL